MPDFPLTIRAILAHGRAVHGTSEVVSYREGRAETATFSEVAAITDRLARGLQDAGLEPGDRVGTLCWNSELHLAAYLAVPSLGAVLHTVNLRLAADQLRYVIDHGGDRFMLVDASLVALLEPIAAELPRVERFFVVGDDEAAAASAARLGERAAPLSQLLAAPGSAPDWPELDERDAAALCYTSGTTGNPRGVAYSHRSTWIHSLAVCTGNAFAISERDRILAMVPMFHANAWGLPFAAWFAGADMVMPGPTLDAASLARIFAEQRPTFTAGVPTLLGDLLEYGRDHELALGTLRMAVCGGSAVPAAIIDALRERYGVPLLQGWGMTETSPLAALAAPPKGTPPEQDTRWRCKSGRPVAGMEMRIVGEDGSELPWDGSVGEIQVRGPWVTAGYHEDPAPEKFSDGWLRTGDVGYGDERGYVQLTDRTKDVIKSGGEWISSVELENTLMGHPDVVEAAVIAVPDDRWQERPLACVALRAGAQVGPAELTAFLTGQVAKWWLPERWAFMAEVPKTSVGKFDKKQLRAEHEAGRIAVESPARA